jgi:elongation factor P
MISVQDLRSGTKFQIDGQLFDVIKYEHIKVGRGSATIKVKVKNLVSGTTLEKTFINSAKVEEVNTLRRKLQYLYKDKVSAIFMDPTSFDQVEIPLSLAKNEIPYIKEGENVDILFWEDRPLYIDIPPSAIVTIIETNPGVKGNSATNVFKPATCENGLIIKVPLFVDKGDKVRVDTRSGEYLERAK